MVSVPAISRRTLQQIRTLVCKDCNMEWRVENITPYTVAVRIYHCVSCGSCEVTECSSYESDRWYAMARSFGIPVNKTTVELLKRMFDMWDPSEHALFKDFVLEISAEVESKINGDEAEHRLDAIPSDT